MAGTAGGKKRGLERGFPGPRVCQFIVGSSGPCPPRNVRSSKTTTGVISTRTILVSFSFIRRDRRSPGKVERTRGFNGPL